MNCKKRDQERRLLSTMRHLLCRVDVMLREEIRARFIGTRIIED